MPNIYFCSLIYAGYDFWVYSNVAVMLPNFLKYKGNMFLSFHVYLHLVIPMRAIVIMIGGRCCFTT